MLQFLNVNIRFVHIWRLCRQENKVAQNIFLTNITYLEASIGTKISILFSEKWDEALWIMKWIFLNNKLF